MICEIFTYFSDITRPKHFINWTRKVLMDKDVCIAGVDYYATTGILSAYIGQNRVSQGESHIRILVNNI